MAIGKIGFNISSRKLRFDSAVNNQNEPSFNGGFIVKYGIPRMSSFLPQKQEKIPRKTAYEWLMEQIAKDKPQTDSGKFKYGIPEMPKAKTQNIQNIDEVCIKYAIPQEPKTEITKVATVPRYRRGGSARIMYGFPNY